VAHTRLTEPGTPFSPANAGIRPRNRRSGVALPVSNAPEGARRGERLLGLVRPAPALEAMDITDEIAGGSVIPQRCAPSFAGRTIWPLPLCYGHTVAGDEDTVRELAEDFADCK
jgi:hypothetical protein